jgi:hypothetical protein
MCVSDEDCDVCECDEKYDAVSECDGEYDAVCECDACESFSASGAHSR